VLRTALTFLPILSRLLTSAGANGVVLYISPLKALINDQWGRLEQLCEALDIPVVPWHGDIAASKKQRFAKQPAGCVLITPRVAGSNSVQQRVVRHGLCYIIILLSAIRCHRRASLFHGQ